MADSLSRWGAYVEQRLGELERGEGDFTGLRRPSAAAVAQARRMCAEAFPSDAPTPSVVPTADGDIDFVWHKGGWDIEVTVTEGCYSRLWANFRAGGRDGIEGDLIDLLPRFRELMAELAAI